MDAGSRGAAAVSARAFDGAAPAPPPLGAKLDSEPSKGDADRSPDRSSEDVVEAQGQHIFDVAMPPPNVLRAGDTDASRDWGNGGEALLAQALGKRSDLAPPAANGINADARSPLAPLRDPGGGAPPSANDAGAVPSEPFRSSKILKRKTLLPKQLPPLFGWTDDKRGADALRAAFAVTDGKADGRAVLPRVDHRQANPPQTETASRPKRDRRSTSRLKASVSDERGKEPLYRCRTCGREKPMQAYDRSTKHMEDREPSCLDCLGKTARKRVTFTGGSKRGRARKAGASRSDPSSDSDGDTREAPAERDAASTLLQLGQRYGAAEGSRAAVEAAGSRPAGEGGWAPGVVPPQAPSPDALGAALGTLDALKDSLLEMQSAMRPGALDGSGSQDFPPDLRQVLALAAQPGQLDMAAVSKVISQHSRAISPSAAQGRRAAALVIKQRLGAWRSLLLRLLGVVTEQLHRHESLDVAVEQYNHAMRLQAHSRDGR